MTLEIQGTLIEKGQTEQISERFQKREFILDLSEQKEGQVFQNYGKFELVQAKCSLMDNFQEGDNVKVHFNIKGQRYEKAGKVSYFVSLQAWKVDKV